MKLKLKQLQGSRTVNIALDNGFSKRMDKEEMVIEIDKSIIICDNPLNVCRCIVKIEKVEEPNFKAGFGILMSYFDSLDREQQEEVNKQLKEVGL